MKHTNILSSAVFLILMSLTAQAQNNSWEYLMVPGTGDTSESCGPVQFPRSGTQATCSTESTTTMSFTSVGRNGTELTGEFAITGPGVKRMSLIGSETVYIRKTWKLESCDKQSMNPPQYLKAPSLEEIVSGLRSIDFTQFYSCEFEQTLSVVSEAGDLSNRNFPREMTILRNQNIQFVSGRAFYFKRTQPADSAADQELAAASSSQVKILKSYGDVLFTTQKQTRLQKNAAVQAWIAQNKAALEQNFNSINQNLSKASMTAKISTIYSVQKAYDFVHNIEMLVSNEQNLDQVVDVRIGR